MRKEGAVPSKAKGLLADPREFSYLMTRMIADQARHRRVPAKAFGGLALVHRGRCGSTVLGTLLKQHPRMYWDGEALTPHSPPERWFRYLQGVRLASRTRDLEKLMRFARDRWYVLSAKEQLFPSIESMFQDLDATGFLRFVLLYRNNPLRWVVSSEVGALTGRWHIRRGNTAKLTKVRVSTQYPSGETLVEQLQAYAFWHQQAREQLSSRSSLELCYETDILDDPVKAYGRICEFVDVGPFAAEVRYERSNPFPLRDTITNFDEVGESLTAAGMGWMLEE